eukprot:6978439-Alexandrium_andersonii.AAC.2
MAKAARRGSLTSQGGLELSMSNHRTPAEVRGQTASPEHVRMLASYPHRPQKTLSNCETLHAEECITKTWTEVPSCRHARKRAPLGSENACRNAANKWLRGRGAFTRLLAECCESFKALDCTRLHGIRKLGEQSSSARPSEERREHR